eukprot:TRINITY_DN10914_c0_g1_i2.p1 TRINITY_DN10914_c0_g1~~TRINITY_DN10914_c0_g1_i2.p1  ORF type:complete len:307 (-),score=52.13 TRINITY_DN10914_c0_g1_i2:50-970(-)
MHPDIICLGHKLRNNQITGTNARCFAILITLRKIIEEYRGSPETINKNISVLLDEVRAYLRTARKLGSGVESYLDNLKLSIFNSNRDIGLGLTKKLSDDIGDFIDQKIRKADDLIIKNGLELINDDDVILTFGRSYVVERLLRECKKKFHLIIVDNPPYYEGRQMALRLARQIPITYTCISGVAYFMRKVQKVFLGASSMLSNGALISRVGTAMISCIAHMYRKPVLVFCETYKFSEKTQLDSLSENELADPQALLEPGDKTTAINLRYDLTPRNYINMVITETGLIPPTSIPVMLRELTRIQGTN